MAKQNDDIKLQERLIDLMNKELLEDFSDLYFKSLLIIKSYEHIELLLYACRFGLLSFVKKILNNNSTVINVNCYHPSTGFPPLFIAIRSQKHLIIEYLIREAKADVNWSCDKIGRTCLNEAIRRWDLSTVALLIEHGAIVDQRHLFISIIECFREKDKVSRI
jgi:ankyrin repeat protein